MNDGLALPAVLALTAAVAGTDGRFDVVRFVLQEVGVGLHTGLLVGFVAARVFPHGSGLAEYASAHQKALYALGVALPAYGVADSRPCRGGW